MPPSPIKTRAHSLVHMILNGGDKGRCTAFRLLKDDEKYAKAMKEAIEKGYIQQKTQSKLLKTMIEINDAEGIEYFTSLGVSVTSDQNTMYSALFEADCEVHTPFEEGFPDYGRSSIIGATSLSQHVCTLSSCRSADEGALDRIMS